MAITTTTHAVHLQLNETTTASIALLGATVYSYVAQGEETLFKSSTSPIEGPKAIRGGIPVCWPIFGPANKEDPLVAKLGQHGFARSSVWKYSGGSETASKLEARFTLTDSDATRDVFDRAFRLEYTVALSADALTISLFVENPGPESLPFQALFHSYLRVPATTVAAETRIPAALHGLTYADKVRGGKTFTEESDDVAIVGPDGEIDRVYYGAPSTLLLAGVSSTLVKVVKTNLADAVVWNPGKSKADALADLEDGGETRFVCIEPGQVGEPVVLAPRQNWTGSVSYVRN